MRDPEVRSRRQAMLQEPHILPLTEYAAMLRERGLGEVPDFDPLDGGINASILFLFEKPGPKTAIAGGGSGFISRDNDDPTAEATIGFMERAEIPRKLTAIWNVIPWWNSTRKVTGRELAAGVACVEGLMALLPNLRVVVLVGQKAARARPLLEAKTISLLASDHPSPLVRAKFPERWNAIPQRWAAVHRFI